MRSHTVKKIFAAILAVLYLFTTGATINLHYCMGKLVDQSLFDNHSEQCSKCGMEKSQQSKDCCKDEHKQLKVNNDHYTPDLSFQKIQLFSDVLPVAFIDVPVRYSSINEENPLTNAPPRSWDVPIFKRICVFRI